MKNNLFNFDKIINRYGTDCIKYDLLEQRYGDSDLLPLWVADMDFETPNFIINAIQKRCNHPVFGYTFPSSDYYYSIIKWLELIHNWHIKRDWLSFMPGIVRGIAYIIEHFSNEGDRIIIQPPVYHPFRLVPQGLKREVIFNPLKMNEKGKYEMDFANLEHIIDDRCKILILSSPHNPAGIVWDIETLQQLAAICRKNNILVISDEIHSEMVYPNCCHYPFPTVSKEAAECSITLMAPSKTFNIAGIIASYVIIPDNNLRKDFFSYLNAGEFNEGSLFSYIATIAAYTEGNEWRHEMLNYVIDNVNFTDNLLRSELPQIKVYIPQASFLVWLDCRELGLSQSELIDLFQQRAKLALNDGTLFGKEGEGFMRINVGCPRTTLKRALNQLITIYKQYYII